MAQLGPFVPLDVPLSEQAGRALGEWAARSARVNRMFPALADLTARLRELAAELDAPGASECPYASTNASG